MSEVWSGYKSFKKMGTTRNQNLVAFIAEFDKEHNLAKAAGCVY